MKKYLNFNSVLWLIVSVILFSCEEYLDVSPDLGIDTEDVFSDYENTQAAVDRASRLVHNYVWHQADWSSEIGAMSDEVQVNRENPQHSVLNSGNWFDQETGGYRRETGGMRFITEEFLGNDVRVEMTEKAFVAIRAVNNVIENIDLLTEVPEIEGFTPQQLKDGLLGQAYFLRAFHYFQVIRRYGGFPIMDKVFSTSYNFDEVRPSYQESSDWLVSDLDEAIELLPEQWNDQNQGRATKSSARGLKAMALLYAASPLMNPDLNPYGSNSKTYNVEKAKEAAAAAAVAISNYPAGGHELFSAEDYYENWRSRTSGYPKEAVILPPQSQNSDPSGTLIGMGWFLPEFQNGWNVYSLPTQNAVDWFETASGYAVDDPEAQSLGGFDPNDPYANRDPRLKMLILCHGDDMYPGLSNYRQTPRNLDVRTAPVGWHTNRESGGSPFFTGYYHKGKHNYPGNNNFHRIRGVFRTFPHIRVAQTYLDFAEAANEAYGPNGAVPGTSLTAVSALNVVRNRIGMPNVLAKYTVNKDELRKRIYNERAVELFQEFHRWHDLRRWKLAKDVFTGVNMIYGADIREVNGQLEYGKRLISGAQRVFEDKHYWYAFPTEVMNIMTVFEQNPGW